MHTKRNRDILESFEAGVTVEQLAHEHGLTAARVRAVLNDERHRKALSPTPFYKAQRAGKLSS